MDVTSVTAPGALSSPVTKPRAEHFLQLAVWKLDVTSEGWLKNLMCQSRAISQWANPAQDSFLPFVVNTLTCDPIIYQRLQWKWWWGQLWYRDLKQEARHSPSFSQKVWTLSPAACSSLWCEVSINQFCGIRSSTTSWQMFKVFITKNKFNI